ncbi:MAG: HAD-IA family hydrolase [Peptococcaceae bacterium]|nr:HAD-IA family hydrolase [Peptococcaceae bacterium]
MSDNASKITAVLFDLDGTLTDSLPLIRRTYYQVFNDLGIPWGNDDVMRWIGRPLKDIAEHFAGRDAADRFVERYQHHYHRDHDRFMALFPGTLEMLEYLKERGIRTGVVTSKGRPGTMRTVEFTGIGPYLDVIVTAHDVERHKPLPDPVLKALGEAGVKADEAIFVGDSHFDLEAGKAAGVRVLGVSWGICSAADLMRCGPLGVLDSWEELRKYIGD